MNNVVLPMLGNHFKLAKEMPIFPYLNNGANQSGEESFVQLFSQLLEQNGLIAPDVETPSSVSGWTESDLDHLRSIILSLTDEEQLKDFGFEQLVHASIQHFHSIESLSDKLHRRNHTSEPAVDNMEIAEAWISEKPVLQSQTTRPPQLAEFIGFVITEQVHAYLHDTRESPLGLNEEPLTDWALRMTKAIEEWKAVNDPQTATRLMMTIKEQPHFLNQVEQKIVSMLQALAKQEPVDSEMFTQTAVHKETVELPLNRSRLNPIYSSSVHDQTEQRTAGGGVELQSMPATYTSNTQLPKDSNLRVTHQHTNFTQLPAEVRVSTFVEQMTPLLVKQMSITQLQGTSEAKIRLIPEHLGQLDIKISITNGQLTAMINSDNTAAKEMLELQLPMLRQALQTQGLQVERLEITYQANQNLGGQHGQGHHSQQQQSGSSPYSPQQGQVAESYESFEEWSDEVEADGLDLTDHSEFSGHKRRSFEATA